MTKKQPPKVNREWHLIDAKNQILGRLAVNIADLLRGKKKLDFQSNKDIGDYVVVKNAKEITVSGKKMEQKIYYRHSGYLGGLKEVKLKEMIKKKPEEVIRHAVLGMLPKNKLKKFWLKRLLVYSGKEHPFDDKLKNCFAIKSSKKQGDLNEKRQTKQKT